MPARAPKARCPDRLHKGSAIQAWGTFRRASGRYRRYRCEPLAGATHWFSVGIEGGRRRKGQAGAPACAEHSGARVVRAGMYRHGTAQPRQRYECDHTGRCRASCRPTCPGKHTFTPALPRAHVHSGEACAECLELRGIHRGEIAAARRHRFNARIVARTLSELSLGLSYGKAGMAAADAAEIPLAARRRAAPAAPPRRRAPAGKKKRRRSAATRLMARFWHIGAGFVEAFGPVVWQATERRLRERAEANAATGLPRVWLIDDVPVYALDPSGKRKKADGYSVLVLAELDWTEAANPGAAKLRLARALPKSTSVAWRLLFAEVGYVPDIVVSDAATPIIAAVGRHFAPPGPLFVPSLWHLARALEKNALEHALRGPNAGEIRRHLTELGRDGERGRLARLVGSARSARGSKSARQDRRPPAQPHELRGSDGRGPPGPPRRTAAAAEHRRPRKPHPGLGRADPPPPAPPVRQHRADEHPLRPGDLPGGRRLPGPQRRGSPHRGGRAALGRLDGATAGDRRPSAAEWAVPLAPG